MMRENLPFVFAKNQQTLTQPGDVVVRVSRELSSDKELLDVLAKGLRFPDYFGRNWNALDECLGDLSWLPEKRVVILHDGLPSLNREALGSYLDALATSIIDEQHHGHRMVVAFPPSVEPQVRALVPLPIRSRWPIN